MARSHRQRLQTTTKPPDKQNTVACLANAFIASTDYNFVQQQKIFNCPINFSLLFYYSALIIRHVSIEKGTGAEMRPVIVSGIVTNDAPVSYWSIFSVPSNMVIVPDVFAKDQFPPVSIQLTRKAKKGKPRLES